MKPITKILSLTLFMAGILVLWLIPKMNQAKNVSYVRIIEDTETGPKVLVTPIENEDTSTVLSVKNQEAKGEWKTEQKSEVVKKQKKYKKEAIQPDFKLKDIKPSMYSRAIHYFPEEELILLDSLNKDSVVSIQ